MRAIWSLILLLTVNTLYVQPDLKTRLDAFFASYNTKLHRPEHGNLPRSAPAPTTSSPF